MQIVENENEMAASAFNTGKQLLTEQMNGPSSRSLRNRRVVDLAFKNIVYTVKPIKSDQRKQCLYSLAAREILRNVTGICPGGQVTAILGSSGAGKTSLLNILAARVSNTAKVSVTGQLLANGQPYEDTRFSSFASYVMQNDVLFETLTPREAFQFVANLKYNDPELKSRRVDDTVKTMKLERCQHAQIGGISFKGISGGERKRTSIGFELVTNPSCILLDEPTSGLDSFTAFQIINELKNLAELQDRTIIFTIHQPSSDIFLLFDRIMLLVNGKFIYQGPRENIISHFAGAGFPCPDHSNPLDYFISIMHTESKVNLQNFPIYFENYDRKLAAIVDKEIEDSSQAEIEMKRVETSTAYQISLIADRAWRAFCRDKLFLQQRFGLAVFIGLLVGGTFWNIGDNGGGYSSMQGVAGCLFFLCINLMFSAIMPVILSFNVERDVFLREENSKLYSTFSYFTGKSMIEIPFCLITPVIQELILYWMCSLNANEGKYVVTHLFISILLTLCGNSIGLCAGCAFTDIKVATSIVPMILMPLIIFSGFFANSKSFYVWIGWLQYLSPVKYAFESMGFTEFEDRSEYIKIDPIDSFDFHVGKWESVAILIAMFVFFRQLAYMFLKGLKQTLQ